MSAHMENVPDMAIFDTRPDDDDRREPAPQGVAGIEDGRPVRGHDVVHDLIEKPFEVVQVFGRDGGRDGRIDLPAAPGRAQRTRGAPRARRTLRVEGGADGKTPYAVSQVSAGDKHSQSYFASKIGGGLSHLQLNHNVKCLTDSDRSQRARSIIFLAYGVLVATALQHYKDDHNVDLYMCENGLISINPPLTPTRLGSLSTRTTHPVFVRMFQELLDAAALKITVKNPYQFKTKGEMLRDCRDQAFLAKHAAKTTSCGRYARNGWEHCGRCLPCLIRRTAFRARGNLDKTAYVYGDLSKDDARHARFDDVRCAARRWRRHS